MKSLAVLLLGAASFAAWAANDYEIQIPEQTYGCRSPEETHRFWTLAVRDKEAAAKYSNEKRCRVFAEGEKVAIVERIPTSKMNGVRSKNDPVTYYVPDAHAR